MPRCDPGSDTPLPEVDTEVVTSMDCDESSTEESLNPTHSVSFPTSFNSSASGTASPNIARIAFLNKRFSRLATFESRGDEDGSLDKSVALIRNIAQTLSNLDVPDQARPSVPASAKLPKLPKTVSASAIEPHWSISEIFSSSQERENAASINRRIGGPDGLRYPDHHRLTSLA